jgi:hypothetical protein
MKHYRNILSFVLLVGIITSPQHASAQSPPSRPLTLQAINAGTSAIYQFWLVNGLGEGFGKNYPTIAADANVLSQGYNALAGVLLSTTSTASDDSLAAIAQGASTIAISFLTDQYASAMLGTGMKNACASYVSAGLTKAARRDVSDALNVRILLGGAATAASYVRGGYAPLTGSPPAGMLATTYMDISYAHLENCTLGDTCLAIESAVSAASSEYFQGRNRYPPVPQFATFVNAQYVGQNL